MDLKGKVAWITGGARMGLAVAQGLSQQGCRIVLSYRSSASSTQTTVDKLISAGGDAAAFRCDLTKRDDIESVLTQIQSRFKRLDVLVNLSSMYEKAPVSDPTRSADSWTSHLRVNAESAYTLSIAAAPVMNKNGGGRIIHISDWTSASGRPRYKDFSAYYVSKVAIKGIVEVMALELAPTILVNAIAPGPMIPPPDLSAAEQKEVADATPLKRWGGAEEIAKTVQFLIQSDFVTGETIRVDGGRHLS